MKKSTFLTALLVVLVMFSFVSCSNVRPGFVGLRVFMIGSRRGEIEQLNVGRYAYGIGREYYKFPTFTTNHTFTASAEEGSKSNEEFVFQSTEGMKVEADIGIAYYFDSEKIVELFKKYHKGEDEIRDIVVRNSIRDSFNKIGSKYAVDDIIGEGKEQLIKEVEADIKMKLGKDGIVIETLSWVSPPRPPQSVIDALNLKVEATQNALRVENEVAQTEAEAKKRKIEIDTTNYEITAKSEAEAQAVLIQAEAQAKANKLLAESISVDLINYEKINKWNGVLPTVTGENTTIVKGF